MLRPPQAPGPARPKDGERAICRGAAAPGQCRRHALQHRGLPDPFEVGGAKTGVLYDPSSEKRRVRALWGDAPKHLLGLPPPAGPLLPGAGTGAHLLCRADHRSRGLCGVHRLRLSGWGGAGPATAGSACGGLSPGDGHRRPGSLCEQPERGGVPTHEHQLRHHAAPGL